MSDLSVDVVDAHDVVVSEGRPVSTRLTTKFMILKLSHRDKSLNAVIVKDHEGKTSGSVLHGLVYAPECALLVIFLIYNAKKIPVHALATLRITGIFL
jgi:hypothetical protein